ncbi:MAG: KamA family radical SAM protein [Desulfocapsaceae bacterium]
MHSRNNQNRRYNNHDPDLMGLDRVSISVKSHRLLHQLLSENPKLEKIMRYAKTEIEALIGVRSWVMEVLEDNRRAIDYYRAELDQENPYDMLSWRDFAAIRLLDYIDHAGMAYRDQNLRGVAAVNNPIKMIWLAVNHGTGGARPPFFEDMLHLFRQFEGMETRELPDRERVEKWMARFPSGLDPRIVKLREENRDRILNLIIDKMESGEIVDRKYCFGPDLSPEQKFMQALDWWDDYRFHLKFAVRSADLLNEMLGNSLDPETMKILYGAEQASIPIFVNPYYLSLLHVRVPYFAIGADLAIRHYVLYSRQLVEEFGHIVAWEKEDQVEPGKPNAAGWLLPSEYHIHRRYPEVAILIPDTTGRACGGLCASCQRMYSFQKGQLNFDLKKLQPDKKWPERLQDLLNYFEQDSQLRDILITGGDALMSSDAALKQLLDGVYQMAKRKRAANKARPVDEKFAEIVRVRLGTRLPVYLPQRITPELIEVLQGFQKKAKQAGIKQFFIQTHVESPMEITPQVKDALTRLQRAGWLVINQHVFTAAASRRGHNAKLRQTLGEVGVLPYYSFSVKGYMENSYNFALNCRAVQEQMEEKVIGKLSQKAVEKLSSYLDQPEEMASILATLGDKEDIAFLASDRNVLNLPGVGKSLSFRVIGITRYGRRILQFDHDPTRRHSPIIEKLGKIIVIESKSVSEYLEQLAEMGEEPADYAGLYGYSIGVTDPRLPIYEYPPYEFSVTEEMTNLDVS